MFCSKILGETFIFNWGDHRDLDARRWLSWLGLTWLGLAWFGLVWLGLAWFGLVWLGLAWFGFIWSSLVWSGLAWISLVQCIALHSLAGKLRSFLGCNIDDDKTIQEGEITRNYGLLVCMVLRRWFFSLSSSVLGVFIFLQFSSLAVLSSRKQLDVWLFYFSQRLKNITEC